MSYLQKVFIIIIIIIIINYHCTLSAVN